MILLALAQAVAGPVLPPPARPRSARPCPAVADTADVVVCAPDQAGYRLRAPPPPPERQALPMAAVKIGTTTLSAEGEAAGLPGGISFNRAMVRLKVPLGRKRR